MTTIGNYKVIKQIGEGGFGRTYLAKHQILGENACLKQNINISKADQRLLRDEAKLMWDLHHHSLPTLRDFLELEDGSSVLVMSYIPGDSLDTIVSKLEKKKRRLDPEHVCWIGQRLLNALHYLHFHGIIHGDVKPGNVIVQPDTHNAILVDYGLSSIKPVASTQADGYTPAFAAPEQIAGKPPLPETDLYGLGLTLIYALGGNPFAKTYPRRTPEPLKTYLDELVLHDPLKRPNWESCDLVKKLSDVREEAFGRRSSGKQLKT